MCYMNDEQIRSRATKEAIFCISIILLLILCAFCSGCQNMMHKSVVLDNSVTAFKITIGDSQSNFIPQVIFGNGRSVLVDMPMQEGAKVYYCSEEKALFQATISRRTTIIMQAGSGAIVGHIKVETEDKKIIDIPIFKLYDPLSQEQEIIIDNKKVEPAK